VVVTQTANDVESELRQLASRAVGEADVELVDLVFRRSGNSSFVRLDIDRAGEVGVGIEDCQRVSRAMSFALDQMDLIPSSYQLEVSSPGIDRPIRSDDDIRRNTGRRVRVLTEVSDNERQSYRGRLLGAEDGCLVLDTGAGEPLRVPLAQVVKAQQDLPF
jgi:ribosome maturation factor RimP